MANYIKGSAREIHFDNGGSVINLSLNKEELMKLPGEYVKLTIAPRRQEDDYGNTHYVKENDYKPKDRTDNSSSKDDKDDLPF